MGSVRDKATKTYIRLPRSIRSVTDPLVRNRGVASDVVKRRGEKGEKIVKKQLQTLLGHKRGRKRR